MPGSAERDGDDATIQRDIDAVIAILVPQRLTTAITDLAISPSVELMADRMVRGAQLQLVLASAPLVLWPAFSESKPLVVGFAHDDRRSWHYRQ